MSLFKVPMKMVIALFVDTDGQTSSKYKTLEFGLLNIRQLNIRHYKTLNTRHVNIGHLKWVDI